MKRSILIVDDEYGLADLLAELLAENGYGADIAINGRIGLEKLGQQRADLVLLDVMMPVMGGPEMARAMRSNTDLASIHIIMMTSLASALPEDVPPLYDGFLLKPFSPEKLYEAIERLLANRSSK
jgi:CheY-like chemotaxis protein